MKVKTAELSGRALDWAVAQCEGIEVEYGIWKALWQVDCDAFGERRCVEGDDGHSYHPSADWSKGGPIIEREKFCAPVWDELWKQWRCVDPTNAAFGILAPDPLVAAMRCYVASKLGTTVEVLDELLKVLGEEE